MTRTVEQCRSLDVNWCNREGVLEPGSKGKISWTSSDDSENSIGYIFHSGRRESNDVLVLRYTRYNKYLDDEPRDVTCRIPIEYTECNFGGERPWFRCPVCSDRVGKLYSTGKYDGYVCRDCGDLIYQSQEYTSDIVKAFRKSREARERLLEEPFNRERLQEFYDAQKATRRTMVDYHEELDEEFGDETASPLRDTVAAPEQMPPFEQWVERLFHRSLKNPEGRPYGYHGRCMATAKSTGERCRQPARGDHGKCYYHGGAEGSGIGEGQTDHAAEAIREALENDQTLEAKLAIGEKAHIR